MIQNFFECMCNARDSFSHGQAHIFVQYFLDILVSANPTHYANIKTRQLWMGISIIHNNLLVKKVSDVIQLLILFLLEYSKPTYIA